MVRLCVVLVSLRSLSLLRVFSQNKKERTRNTFDSYW